MGSAVMDPFRKVKGALGEGALKKFVGDET